MSIIINVMCSAYVCEYRKMAINRNEQTVMCMAVIRILSSCIRSSKSFLQLTAHFTLKNELKKDSHARRDPKHCGLSSLQKGFLPCPIVAPYAFLKVVPEGQGFIEMA